MDYQVSEISTKVLGIDEDEYVSFAIKASVENLSDDEDVDIELQGIDADGFEILTVFLSGHIPVGKKKILTTKEDMVDNSLYEQITLWQAK